MKTLTAFLGCKLRTTLASEERNLEDDEVEDFSTFKRAQYKNLTAVVADVAWHLDIFSHIRRDNNVSTF